MCRILSWRILWTTMIVRIAPDAPPQSALIKTKMTIVDRAVHDRPTMPAGKTLLHYFTKIACLGGYLARAQPPTRQYRDVCGWSRLMDIRRGAELMQPKCG
ncbi:hypothetical protein [Siccirubricoccus deserti]|uniref:Uncharacterized protein n=1 Tax=Siccirubricoccus deserti TaxID=2013562 RepID=A0A9X0UIC7_9PROT|nr:hypothetical protein [Siccirubricoccus deserti]MBC4016975.1 hypothetical protein [Siccirubricoccus deserti]